MSRRALITGVGGFIGRQIAWELLQQGVETAGIYRSEMPGDALKSIGLSQSYQGNVTLDALNALDGPFDEIYHCAGSGSVAISMAQPELDFDANVLTTQAVFEYARKHAGTKVILPSSAGVYGSVQSLPIAVDHPCHPISPYGTNKRIGEMIALNYARNFGVPVAIVRLFSVYGAGLRKQLLWDACQKLKQGNMQFFGTGQETRDWIHVQDAAKLLVRLADHADVTAPRFNGGTGEAVEICRILGQLAENLGVTAPLAFSGEARAGDPQHYRADMTEVMNTGWTPHVSLADGLLDYTQWFNSREDKNPTHLLSSGCAV